MALGRVLGLSWMMGERRVQLRRPERSLEGHASATGECDLGPRYSERGGAEAGAAWWASEKQGGQRGCTGEGVMKPERGERTFSGRTLWAPGQAAGTPLPPHPQSLNTSPSFLEPQCSHL